MHCGAFPERLGGEEAGNFAGHHQRKKRIRITEKTNIRADMPEINRQYAANHVQRHNMAGFRATWISISKTAAATPKFCRRQKPPWTSTTAWQPNGRRIMRESGRLYRDAALVTATAPGGGGFLPAHTRNAAPKNSRLPVPRDSFHSNAATQDRRVGSSARNGQSHNKAQEKEY